MSCDEMPDNLRSLWDEFGANPSVFSADQLRRETARIQAKRRRGQIVVVGFLLVMVAAYGLSLFLFPNTVARVGATLSVLVCGYWLVHSLIERARTVPDMNVTDGVRFYRAELEHARDGHRWMSWRSLLLPGPFILFDIGCAQIYAGASPFIVWFVCFDCALLLVAFAILGPAKNFKLARKYQDIIDALDAVAGRDETDRDRER
jgi:hypothetical protein